MREDTGLGSIKDWVRVNYALSVWWHVICMSDGRLELGQWRRATMKAGTFMKIHVKKKAYRVACKANAKAGLMNNANGGWQNRASFADTSMKRDFSPQTGK